MEENKEIAIIKDKLKNIGVEIFSETLKLNEKQGFISRVFIVDSNVGKLVIHIIGFIREQKKQRSTEKVFYLSKLLREKTNLPISEVLLEGDLPGGKKFTAQKKLEGTPLGEGLIIENGNARKGFFEGNKKYARALNKCLSEIHNIQTQGFGFLVPEGEKWVGKYPSWLEYLKTESADWLKNIFEHKIISEEKYLFLKDVLIGLLEKNRKSLILSNPCLVHGDMASLGNVLINEGKISGIIDTEWAFSGDPAWDLAFAEEKDIEDYFKIRKIEEFHDQEDFQERIKLYETLWFLWAANVLSERDIERAKNILFRQFLAQLNKM